MAYEWPVMRTCMLKLPFRYSRYEVQDCGGSLSDERLEEFDMVRQDYGEVNTGFIAWASRFNDKDRPRPAPVEIGIVTRLPLDLTPKRT